MEKWGICLRDVAFAQLSPVGSTFDRRLRSRRRPVYGNKFSSYKLQPTIEVDLYNHVEYSLRYLSRGYVYKQAHRPETREEIVRPERRPISLKKP